MVVTWEGNDSLWWWCGESVLWASSEAWSPQLWPALISFECWKLPHLSLFRVLLQDVPAGPAGSTEDGFFVPPTKGTSPAQVMAQVFDCLALELYALVLLFWGSVLVSTGELAL